MKASKKSPGIEKLLNAFIPSGKTRVECIEIGICTCCGKSAKDFGDLLSEKEYTISGLCQKCQDTVWGRK